MIYRLIIFLSCCTLYLKSGAQVYILEEDFETSDGKNAPSGWTQTVHYGTSLDSFQFDDSFYHFSPGIKSTYALFDSYNAGDTSVAGTYLNGMGEIISLSSPLINTSSYSNMYLGLDYYLRVFKTKFQIEVSSNAGNNWTQVWSRDLSTVYTQHLELDLSAYRSSGFMVRFTWYNNLNSGSSGYLALDNIYLFYKVNYDLRLEISNINNRLLCMGDSLSIQLDITNTGLVTANTYAVHTRLSGVSQDSSLQIAGSLSPGTSQKVQVPKFRMDSSGNVQVQIYLTFTADLNTWNDTVYITVDVHERPLAPEVTDGVRCGSGKLTLYASNQNGSVHWFSDSVSSDILAVADTFITDSLRKSTVFYASSLELLNDSISTYQGPWRFSGSVNGGCFFSLNAKEDIILSALSCLFATAADSNHMQIYLKTGTYKGFETQQNAWSLIQDTNVSSLGFGKYIKIRIPRIYLRGGEIVSIYVVSSGGSSPSFKSDSMYFSNAYLSISGDELNNSFFSGSLFKGYSWDGMVHYELLCESERKAAEASLIGRPAGLSIDKGILFEGVYRQGTSPDPDIVFAGKSVEYTMGSPAGYSWSDYGVKWQITAIDLRSKYGYLIHPADTQMVFGSGTGKVHLTYLAPHAWSDSTLTLQIVVADLLNGCDTTLKRFLNVAPRPMPKCTFTQACEGQSTRFLNQSTIVSGSLQYKWFFGDGDSSVSSSPGHTYKNFGIYQVRLQLRSERGYRVDTVFNIQVFELPVSSFSVISACENEPVRFINQSQLSTGNLSYFWEFGDNTSSSLKNPLHQYPGYGSYQVRLTASSNGCSHTVFRTANQFPLPVASYVIDTPCTDMDIRLRSTSGISGNSGLAVRWKLNNEPGYRTGAETSFKFPYGVQPRVELLVISEFSCQSVLVDTPELYRAPVALFDVRNKCDKSPSQFLNGSASFNGNLVRTYWSFGDGKHSTLENPLHQYSNSGGYDVTLVVEDSVACRSTERQSIFIAKQAQAYFRLTDSCSREVQEFINLSTNLQGSVRFHWSFGDGDTSVEFSPSHTYEDSIGGIYTVRLRAITASECSSVYEREIRVLEKPVCRFSYIRDDLNYTFYAQPYQSLVSSILWTIGDEMITDSIAHYTLDTDSDRVYVMLEVFSENACSCVYGEWIPSAPSGISYPVARKLSIFPNPSTGKVQISSGVIFSPETKVLIYDEQGRQVWFLQSENAHRSLELDLGELAAGTYRIVVHSSNSSFSGTLVLIPQ